MSLPSDQTPPAALFLRRLVTALTVVMMGGMIAIALVIVFRFPDPTPVLPENLRLPAGSTISAVTQGKGWIAIVTDQQEILIFDAVSGSLRQTLQINSAQ
jgi:hypothetical protein